MNAITLEEKPAIGTVVVLCKDAQIREMIYVVVWRKYDPNWSIWDEPEWWWWNGHRIVQKVESDVVAWAERCIRRKTSACFMGLKYVEHHAIGGQMGPNVIVRGQ